MIEAMACGTPVFAFRCGSVPEVIDDGVSGFVVDDVAGAIEAVRRIGTIDRDGVRAVFERRFTVGRMAREYVALYRQSNGARIEAPHLRRQNRSEEHTSELQSLMRTSYAVFFLKK